MNSAPNVTLRSEAEVKFKEYGGEDLEVDAFELQDILNSVFTKGLISLHLTFVQLNYSYSHFNVGSLFDDIRLHIAWSYTSSADSPFSFDIILTLSNIFS